MWVKNLDSKLPLYIETIVKVALKRSLFFVSAWVM